MRIGKWEVTDNAVHWKYEEGDEDGKWDEGGAWYLWVLDRPYGMGATKEIALNNAEDDITFAYNEYAINPNQGAMSDGAIRFGEWLTVNVRAVE